MHSKCSECDMAMERQCSFAQKGSEGIGEERGLLDCASSEVLDHLEGAVSIMLSQVWATASTCVIMVAEECDARHQLSILGVIRALSHMVQGAAPAEWQHMQA